MADEQIPEMPLAPGGRRVLRVFLMVAGGLAAPCLALAAFFLSSGGPDTPSRPTAAQPGAVTGSAAPRATPPAPAAATTTTTAPGSPAAPVPPAGPGRDPFAPLVTGGTAAGAPAR